jgi:hypothetical protein
MSAPSRLLALALSATVLTAQPVPAADPAGSAPTARLPAGLPPPPPPPPQALPDPGLAPGPVGPAWRPLLPDLPHDPAAHQDARVDTLIGVLGAAGGGAGTCTGLIPCCNTAQDAGCDFVSYDIACVEAGGFIHIEQQPDGSMTYSCPVP